MPPQEGRGVIQVYVLHRGIELHAIAGGEDHGFGYSRLAGHGAERARERIPGKSQSLAQLEGRRAMTDADYHQGHSRGPSSMVIQTNVKTTAAKPAMPSTLARRPPQPVRWRATMSPT